MDKPELPEFEKIELTVPKGLLAVLDLFSERRGLPGGRDEMIKGLLLGFGEACARDLDAEDSQGVPLPDMSEWSTVTVGIPKSGIAILERLAVELNTEVAALISRCLQEFTHQEGERHKALAARDPKTDVH